MGVIPPNLKIGAEMPEFFGYEQNRTLDFILSTGWHVVLIDLYTIFCLGHLSPNRFARLQQMRR